MIADLIKLAGFMAAMFAAGVILLFAALLVLAVICAGWGAYVSVSEPVPSAAEVQAYQDLQADLNNVSEEKFMPAYMKEGS